MGEARDGPTGVVNMTLNHTVPLFWDHTVGDLCCRSLNGQPQ